MIIDVLTHLRRLREQGNSRSIAAILCLILLQVGLLQPGEARPKPIVEQTQLSFEVAPRMLVKVVHHQDGDIQVHLPSGAKQHLARAGSESPGLEIELSALDVDFDGRLDLVVQVPVGMVNYSTAVYRFDLGLGEFVKMPVIRKADRSCGEFGLIELDSDQQVLRSRCRSSIWRTDVYRPSGGALYLFRSERMLTLPTLDGKVLSLEPRRFGGPLAVWSSHSPAAEILERAINDGLSVPDNGRPLVPLAARVVPMRLLLFDRPGAPSTQRYLVQGDRVEMLDEQDGWLQVRYRNPKRGAVTGWINVND